MSSGPVVQPEEPMEIEEGEYSHHRELIQFHINIRFSIGLNPAGNVQPGPDAGSSSAPGLDNIPQLEGTGPGKSFHFI